MMMMMINSTINFRQKAGVDIAILHEKLPFFMHTIAIMGKNLSFLKGVAWRVKITNNSSRKKKTICQRADGFLKLQKQSKLPDFRFSYQGVKPALTKIFLTFSLSRLYLASNSVSKAWNSGICRMVSN